ncbi:ribonuclease P protein component [Niabella ginsenosidivorans]|uniref:Ribonuclease P protein component n=1 Tax=Niabella ginsenosidivorans TaxID=1176587 RepID=A0A1A9HX15_9BACT|nr:ribonuclease P protein component [Niabella ginsenosidivorans]ANH79625.1 ribonuclease P protein component [Niabella ginsenosidivorans]
MSVLKYTFPKEERLKSRKKLQELFSSGKRIYAGPLKLLYVSEPAQAGFVKCGVGANGRYFKKAVDRNRIKRLLREAYRLQQHSLKEHALKQSTNLSVFLLFTGKELPDYGSIYESVEIALQKLLKQLNEVAV